MRDERKAVETKLGAARTRLVLERPFIGALVLHLPLVPAGPPRCTTVATDARALYYNPGFVASLTLAETQFVLAHEALHCALGHFARRAHRMPARWDAATDHAVNLLLLDEGLQAPPGALANPAFRGLSAEEIYPLIPPDTSERPLDRHLFGEGAAGELQRAGVCARAQAAARPAPRAPAAGEREELALRWRARVAAAAQQIRRAGRLGASWERRIASWIAPELPWRVLLGRYLTSLARDDYSFQRPQRRESEALLPRLGGGEVDLHVALDTSGSIAEEDLAQFAAELEALKAQVRARVTVHACDVRLDPTGPWVYQPWEPLVLPRWARGGGGTRFTPVFEWIARARARPDALLYFTDAEGEFPREPPDYPVLWLVKGAAPVPFGERIALN